VSTAAASPNDTREQILRVARKLIQTRSYLGFSFQDIANLVGIRKPSLYHHFPSKEALGVEVLRRSTEAFEVWTAAMTIPPARKLDAYIRMFRDTLHAGQQMCPAGALAPGWDCIDAELRAAVQALRRTQIDWLTGVLAELGPPRQARQRAGYLFAACQGSLLSARMTGDVADFDDAIALARRSLLA
jgi:TetR/AcrR family transcriptional repressor of nem operon